MDIDAYPGKYIKAKCLRGLIHPRYTPVVYSVFVSGSKIIQEAAPFQRLNETLI